MLPERVFRLKEITMYTFNIEITDTFGGEANYSWVRRYTYKAKSFQGAIVKLAREHGKGWTKQIECGDYCQYKLANACITAFVTIQD
jgi:hypothetical protein